MDASPERMSRDLPSAISDGQMEGAFVVDHSSQPSVCFLCRKILAPDNQATDDLETTTLCGDCKFLLLEDLATPEQYSHRRRHPSRSRRNRPSSSESIENPFSQEFSHMINMVRQNQSSSSGLGDQTPEADLAARSFQHTSSCRTPISSRRWRRILSDSETDGFDNLESLYGDSESNVSFSRYRVFHGDSDTVSFSAYGGDSDDGHSFLDGEIFVNPDNGSNFDSDTDIDPMHAGLDQWNWDNLEDGEGEEDGEWEEADAEDDTVGFTISRAGLRNMFISSPSEINFTANNFPSSFHHVQGFEQVLDHLSESDSLRRGAPPASVSYVNNLPRIIVSEELEKHDGLVCAICKDVLTVGTEVSRLPCSHLYHPSCILPWLTARNSCPLCRYELPTDDKDYEEGKQHGNAQLEIPEIREQDASEDGYSENSSEAEAACELGPSTSGRTEVPDVDTTMNSSVGDSGDWLFRAAAPIVGIVGIILVLWLGRGQGLANHCNLPTHGQHSIQTPSPSLLNQRGNRSRRWFFF
ncbi:hypothetical protein SLE2022_313400 [Rubroshorea leprosula]